MNTQQKTARRQGFTLVELLVVIAIIAILASLGFTGFRSAIEAAKKASAKNHVVGLVQAIDAYYDDYSQLPKEGTSYETNTSFMGILVGLDSYSSDNPKKTSFFNAAKAKGAGSNYRDGLRRTASIAELYDPWGELYHVELDDDYDNKIANPLSGGDSELYGVRSLAYSYGRDKAENGNDDVKSWEQ
ncbi:MAG: type II secretion system protein [Verrucomicrobiales bacterium]